MSAEVTRCGLIDLQVCVPEDWSDAQAEQFANAERPTGIDSRWTLRAADDPAQNGAPIRVACDSRAHHVHIMMSC